MKRLAYVCCLSLGLTAAVPVSLPAQTSFASQVRGACASEVAAMQKYLVEMQGFTLAEADDNQINPRMQDLSTLPRYALKETAEHEGDTPLFPLQRCAARLRLSQLLAESPPVSAATLAQIKATAASRCMQGAERLRARFPNPRATAGEVIDLMMDDLAILTNAELADLISSAEETTTDPAAEMVACLGRVVVAHRAGGLAERTSVETPPPPASSSNPNGATAEQIAAADALNARSREIAARERAEGDAFMRDAAIRAGKIYQSSGPEGRQIDLHPTTGQRCVTAELGPTEPYGDGGRTHVVNFTNVCDKIFSVRARIIPLGPVSDTSGGVQGTGIGAGSLGGPAKSRVICIQDPSRRAGTCSGFTEWWAWSSS